MRQLSKIIFINSATIRYEEVNLDGNVHFIGTQGVGKSTLLRAILFFYNADTLKLGIPREKQPFAEYYFKKSNSSLIFEVKGESGYYCILAYKQSGRIAYRFIDSPYDINHYIKDKLALDPWDKIRSNLDQAGIDYSNKIERYEEYRNILYGNYEGKTAYRKYALLESKLYQNIPRTIQNVFLNAKLEADFIKQTIIDSLSEEAFEIDLGTYRYHLNDFETEYKDIETFKTKKTAEKGEKIIGHHNLILKARADKLSDLLLLEQAAVHEKRKLPLFEKKIDELRTKLAKENTKLEELSAQHFEKTTSLTGGKGEIEGKKKTAEQKLTYYREKNIEEIMTRVSKKQDQQTRLNALEKEHKTILTAYGNIDEKYKALEERLSNNFGESRNAQQAKAVELKSDFNRFSDEVNLNFEEMEEEIRQRYKGRLFEATALVNKLQSSQTAIEKSEIELKGRRFYEKELEAIRQQITTGEKQIAEHDHTIKIKDSEKQSLLKTLGHETEKLETNYRYACERVDALLNTQQVALEKLTQQIENSSQAFFGYLNEHYPGWEETIGKVCRDEIIFNSELSPDLVQAGNLLFGIKLDLGGMTVKTKTLEGYLQEKATLEKHIEELNTQKQALLADKEAKSNKLTKVAQSKARSLSDDIQILSYDIQSFNSKVQQWKIDELELLAKSKTEKEKALAELAGKLIAARQTLEKAREHSETLNHELTEQIATHRAEKNLKIDAARTGMEQALKKMDEELAVLKKNFERDKTELQNNKHAELEGKGLDTTKLKDIEIAIGKVKQELQFINQNYDITVQYKNDKKEYIDKLEWFNTTIILKEEEIKAEKEKFERQKSEILLLLSDFRENLNDATGQLQDIQKQLEQYEQFAASKEYEPVTNTDSKVPEITFAALTSYITKIKEAHYSLIEQSEQLTTATNDFISRFNSNNMFNFKPVTEQGAYLEFAQTLREFIDENKIAEFEKRVNKRYADIIQIISSQTSDLMAKSGDIQRVIGKINQDFKEKNFVGAISLIELKIEEGSNRVVEILRRIKAFHAEHEFNTFGNAEPNLFSGQADEKRITQAIGLLTHLVQMIKESKSGSINITDSFELKFRVVENLNDSGWVEKLSNVGSEGTDILVKAMINIMLLNVFKDSASRKFKDFRLHCMMDEIGRLHPGNVRGILKFANDRNIVLINGSPIEQDALAYKYIYELRKDQERNTRVKRLVTTKS
jgi:hypothetical protein